ncbi:hypothetical protein AB0E63_29995 [Kribbella sp. NPDC026596]|uniref:hypothetical protein n=1 Tax=Kribbella sp. NPDC026596 TaxID=3155122 RepID=UPI0033E7B676
MTRLEEGFDLSALVDEIERHCWISGCRLRLTATHPGPRDVAFDTTRVIDAADTTQAICCSGR